MHSLTWQDRSWQLPKSCAKLIGILSFFTVTCLILQNKNRNGAKTHHFELRFSPGAHSDPFRFSSCRSKSRFVLMKLWSFEALQETWSGQWWKPPIKPSLKLTTSLHLKKWMVGIRSFPFWDGLFSGAFAVSFREGNTGKFAMSTQQISNTQVIFRKKKTIEMEASKISCRFFSLLPMWVFFSHSHPTHTLHQ